MCGIAPAKIRRPSISCKLGAICACNEYAAKFCKNATGALPDLKPVPATAPTSSALDTQVAGGHYKSKGIQPVEYAHANGLNFFEGSVVKYVTRWQDKGGISDLEKAKHFLELLIELEGRATT